MTIPRLRLITPKPQQQKRLDYVMQGRQPLWVEALRYSSFLRRTMLRAIIKRPDKAGAVVRRINGAAINVDFFGAWWTIRRAGKVIADGRGLLRLAATLYGTSTGEAAVLLLDAATFEIFDDEAKCEIAAAIDKWAAREAQARNGD